MTPHDHRQIARVAREKARIFIRHSACEAAFEAIAEVHEACAEEQEKEFQKEGDEKCATETNTLPDAIVNVAAESVENSIPSTPALKQENTIVRSNESVSSNAALPESNPPQDAATARVDAEFEAAWKRVSKYTAAQLVALSTPPLAHPADSVNRNAVDAIIEALEFYADPDTYFAIGFIPGPPCGDFMQDFELVDDGGSWCQRPGKHAREALATYRKQTEK